MEANPSPETLVDAAVNTAANGGGTVEEPAIKLADLSKVLGTDFKDTATALQSIKETKDFVGKRQADAVAEAKASLQQTTPHMSNLESDVQSLKADLFYSQNPQYQAVKPLIAKLGSDPSTVVNSEEFKSVFEKVKVADEVAQNKSVVQSNQRLSQTPAPILEQAVNIANARGSTLEDVATVFAQEINKQGQE
jgi:hypothetical protein